MSNEIKNISLTAHEDSVEVTVSLTNDNKKYTLEFSRNPSSNDESNEGGYPDDEITEDVDEENVPSPPIPEKQEDKEKLKSSEIMHEPNFEESVEFVLAHEGGYVNDPNDAGGETNWGISKRSYPDLDIKNLTREEAIEIYRRDFWEASRANQISHGEIAKKVFDFCVNMGERRGVRLLQQAINDVWALSISTDGRIGPQTLGAIDTAIERDGWRMLYIAYSHRAAMFYRNLNQPRFLRGWLRRAFS